MNYEIWTDEPTPLLLDEFTLFPETRPHVGDIIGIKNDSTVYKITRTEPTGNPGDSKVKYFVILHEDPVSPQTQINDRVDYPSW